MIKVWLLKAFYFLHLTDGNGQLDITDLSFMAIVVKMLFAPTFSWEAACTMIPILALQAHQNHMDYLKTLPANKT